jgi:hypothetical protein
MGYLNGYNTTGANIEANREELTIMTRTVATTITSDYGKQNKDISAT